MNIFNPNWILSRLLEKCGIADYNKRVEFAAHFFAGCTFALLGLWTTIAWTAWTIWDEFHNDGFKGRDTYWDLLSKLLVPILYMLWRILCA